MIAMNLKSHEKILDMLEGKEKIVLFGDSGCAQLGDVGGILQLEDMEEFLLENDKQVLGHIFVEGGICDVDAFRHEIQRKLKTLESADAYLVQACGVATQIVTDLLPEKESFPATDSVFVGKMSSRFNHEETCTLCGDCILHLTAGICPIARCPKGILNGPCGGSMDGMCEQDDHTECVWQLIYDRLKLLGKLDNLKIIWPMRNWNISQGPQSISKGKA